MKNEITTISLKNGIAAVNCYLIRCATGYFLIDTGFAGRRKILEEKIRNAGCIPGTLKLILVTHGDSDHVGNCRYLRDAFTAGIAMHKDDVGMAETGNMFWNRDKVNPLLGWFVNSLLKLHPSDRFTPDILLKDGDNLAEYGLDAEVIAIAGHSKGSIGILTSEGELFCGDFFENIKKPKLNMLMPDKDSALASRKKLDDFSINTIYPGHGKLFHLSDLDN